MHAVRLRPAFVVLAVVFSALFLGGPLAVAVLVLIFAPFSIAVWVALACIAFAGVLVYAMSSSNQWVELNDGVIRAKRLLTRRVVTQDIRHIVTIKELNSAAMGPLENLVLDALMKTSNRGYELRFRDGTKIGLVRGDMARAGRVPRGPGRPTQGVEGGELTPPVNQEGQQLPPAAGLLFFPGVSVAQRPIPKLLSRYGLLMHTGRA